MTDPLGVDFPVSDRTSCLAVIEALARHSEQHPDEWENQSITAYLDAVGAWLTDAQIETHDDRAWALLADALRAGRVYE